MSALRWGLLGTARINRLLIPAIRASARSVVAAVASRAASRAQAYAREWGIPGALGSYEALLGSDIDILYVPLPNSLHAHWTLAALAAGKHVLCEKPLALRVDDVHAVAAAAAAHRRVVTEGFMYRHHARTQRVEELLAAGAIGELQLVAGTFSYRRSRAADVRLDPALGGGALWDVGCYPVSFAQMCAGAEPRLAIGWHHTGPTGVDEQFAGTVVDRQRRARAGFRQLQCGLLHGGPTYRHRRDARHPAPIQARSGRLHLDTAGWQRRRRGGHRHGRGAVCRRGDRHGGCRARRATATHHARRQRQARGGAHGALCLGAQPPAGGDRQPCAVLAGLSEAALR